MGQVGFIFAVGIGGVFLSMGLIYGTIRFTAALVDLMSKDRKQAKDTE